MTTSSPRRSALLFVLDVTGEQRVVYRVAVYLQDLLRRLGAAPGLQARARIDVLVGDAHGVRPTSAERVLDEVLHTTHQPRLEGLRVKGISDAAHHLPSEGGGFHVFVLLTRDLFPGWQYDVPDLHGYVASVTGLCCGPQAKPETARLLSKEPGGTRVVNPLDEIQKQFDSIATWLIANFGDPTPVALPVVLAADPPPLQPSPAPARAPGGKWRVLEPTDRSDPTPHEHVALINGAPGWRLIGASRRGKLHANEGTYRDDEFALGTAPPWNLVAIADGAGSCRLSRVGARVGSQAAIDAMAHSFTSQEQHRTYDPEAWLAGARQAVLAGLVAAHGAVAAEADRRQIAMHDLSSTLLLIAHAVLLVAPDDRRHIIGVAQVGDGMICAAFGGGEFQELGEPLTGYYSGETIFLTSVAPGSLDRYIRVHTLTGPVRVLAAMTDGIADDLYPRDKQLPILFQAIASATASATPDRNLLAVIGYEKRDSADDRTLAVLVQTGEEPQ